MVRKMCLFADGYHRLHFLLFTINLDIVEVKVADGVLVVIATEDVLREFRGITVEKDVLEPYTTDVVTRLAVVLRREVHLHVEQCATLCGFNADILKMDVLKPVLVATAHSKNAIAIGLQNVAVLHPHIFKRFAHFSTVVAMCTQIERMGKVVEDGGTADVEVFAAAPVPPAVIVEGNGIVVVAQEYIFDSDILAAHQVYAVTPWTAREAADVADGDVFRLPTKDGVMLRIDDGEPIDEHMLRKGYLNTTQWI